MPVCCVSVVLRGGVSWRQCASHGPLQSMAQHGDAAQGPRRFPPPLSRPSLACRRLCYLRWAPSLRTPSEKASTAWMHRVIMPVSGRHVLHGALPVRRCRQGEPRGMAPNAILLVGVVTNASHPSPDPPLTSTTPLIALQCAGLPLVVCSCAWHDGARGHRVGRRD